MVEVRTVAVVQAVGSEGMVATVAPGEVAVEKVAVMPPTEVKAAAEADQEHQA